MLRLIQKSLGWACSFYLKAFRLKLTQPRKEQLELLENLLHDLAYTEYGRSLGITGKESLEEFQTKVPLVEYSDMEPWIEKQKATRAPVLTRNPVLFYEKTSGSSGPSKYIPYTKKLRTTFGRMAYLWIGDILHNGPKLSSGKTFISISPAFLEEIQTDLGVPIGLGDDSDYLPALAKFFLSRFLVTPPGIKKLKDPTDYRWVLACALLAAENLEILSIWNPAYFTALLDFITQEKIQMAEDLRSGQVRRGGMSFKFHPLSETRLHTLLSCKDAPDWKRLWPSLASRWTAGHRSST